MGVWFAEFFEPHSFSLSQTAACPLYSFREARVVFKLIVKPVVFLVLLSEVIDVDLSARAASGYVLCNGRSEPARFDEDALVIDCLQVTLAVRTYHAVGSIQ